MSQIAAQKRLQSSAIFRIHTIRHGFVRVDDPPGPGCSPKCSLRVADLTGRSEQPLPLWPIIAGQPNSMEQRLSGGIPEFRSEGQAHAPEHTCEPRVGM